ncbi:MAG TPA: LytTR family DNA-binding domain-containing protein [Blastocatellia bacterium]|nr:LytTR family DNA-binding domain-containing protein [Blastocatellia bacterium]
MNTIRTVIVDDELLGRTVIREMLRGDADITIIGECANGREAIALIRRERPDLLFLDVQMPVLDGFAVLAALDSLPFTIFVTAYDQYAVRAFEVHAVDYLLKPFDRERFGKALQRAKTTIKQAQTSAINERILALLEAQQTKAEYLERLVIKANGRVLFLSVDEIDWIEAQGNYICLHSKKESYLLRETISGLEAQLDPKKFARIHRSHIVQLDRIKELHPWSHGEYHVLLKDGTELTLSRSYRDHFQALLGQAM